jgi:hypothetical protein
VLKAHKVLSAERRQKKYGFYDLYKDKATLKQVKDAAAHFSEMEQLYRSHDWRPCNFHYC